MISFLLSLAPGLIWINGVEIAAQMEPKRRPKDELHLNPNSLLVGRFRICATLVRDDSEV
uniref:Uncharacterized protein n=1 Tax=Bradyrhizobium ottawaense TaxID=931866 RepID=A0A2U8P4D9_9BRAD|nr:hypothetical protein CIT37_10195 [Bradyrhizobium ottawaense]